MTIMITGGGGFIGARAVRKLLDRGHDVVCFEAGDLGRLGDAAGHDRLAVVRGDVSQADDVTAAIRQPSGEIVGGVMIDTPCGNSGSAAKSG